MIKKTNHEQEHDKIENKESSENLIIKLIKDFKLIFFKSFSLTLITKDTSFFLAYFLKTIHFIQIILIFFNSSYEKFWDNNKYFSILKEISDIFLIVPFLMKKNYYLFMGFLYFICFFIILAYFFIFLISNKKRNKKNFSFILNLFFIKAFSTILIIPSFLVFFENLNCQEINNEFVLKNFENIKCFADIQFFNFIISIFFTILLFTYTFFTNFLYFENKCDIYIPLARKSSIAPKIIFILQIFLTISKTFIYYKEFDYVFLITILLLSLSVSYIFHFNNPYYNFYISKFFTFFSTLLSWTIINLFLSKILINNLKGQFLIIWLITIPILIIIEINRDNLLIKNILEPFEKIRNSEGILRYLKILINLYNNQHKDKTFNYIIDGYIEVHKEKCKLSHCPLKKIFIDKSVPQSNYYKLRNYSYLCKIEYYFERGIKHYPGNLDLRLNYIFFILEKFNKKDTSLYHLEIISKKKPNFEQSFLIYRYIKEIEEIENSEESEAIMFGGECKNLIAYQNALHNFLNEIKLSINFYIEFWQQLTKDNPDFIKIKNLGLKIHLKNKTIKDNWDKFSRIFVNKKSKYMLFYGNYLIKIANNKKKGTEMIKNAKILIKNEYLKKSDLGNFNPNTDLNQRSIGSVIISGEKRKLGEILKINKTSLIMFGYNEKDVIGKNVKLLMPDIIAINHNKFLEKTVKRNQLGYFKQEKLIFALNKNGYIFQIYAIIKYIQFPRPFFISFKKIKKEFGINAIFMTDDGGNILHISSGIITLFNLTKKDIKNKNNFKDYFVDIFEKRLEYAEKSNIQVNEDNINFENIKKLKSDLELEVIEQFIPLMKDPVYYFIFRKTKSISVIKKRTKTNLCNFYFSINKNKKKIMAKRGRINKIGLHKVDYDSNSEKSIDNIDNKLIDYGEGIKTLRLENGKTVEIEEIIENDIIENKKIKENKNSTKSKTVNLKNKILKNFFENLHEEKKDKKNKNNMPLFMKYYFFLFHLFLFFTFGLILFDFYFRSLKMKKLNYYSNFYIDLSIKEIVLQDIVSDIKRLNIKNNFPDYYFTEKYLKNKLDEDIIASQNLENKLLDDINKINDENIFYFYYKEIFEIYIDDKNNKNFELSEVLKNLATNSFKIKQAELNKINLKNKDVIFTYYNIMNNVNKKINDLKNYICLTIEDFKSFTPILLISSIFFIFIIIFSFFILYVYLVKKRKFFLNIISLFLEIPNKELKSYLKKCENFMGNLNSQMENGELLELNEFNQESDDEEEKTFLKKKKKIQNIKFEKKIFIKFFICLIIILGFFLYSLITYILKTQKINIINKELNLLSTLSKKFNYINNSLYLYILDKKIPINFEDSETFNEKAFQNLFDLDGALREIQFLNIINHSTKFNEYTNNLLMKSLCEIKEQKNLKECNNWLNDNKKRNFVEDGLSLGMSHYQINMRKMYLEFKNSVLNKNFDFFKNKSCPENVKEFHFCIFNKDLFIINEEFQEKFFNFYFEHWMKKFHDDFVNNFASKFLQIQIYILLASIFFIIFMYLLFFIKYYKNQKRNVSIIQNMVLMIPVESYKKNSLLTKNKGNFEKAKKI